MKIEDMVIRFAAVACIGGIVAGCASSKAPVAEFDPFQVPTVPQDEERVKDPYAKRMPETKFKVAVLSRTAPDKYTGDKIDVQKKRLALAMQEALVKEFTQSMFFEIADRQNLDAMTAELVAQGAGSADPASVIPPSEGLCVSDTKFVQLLGKFKGPNGVGGRVALPAEGTDPADIRKVEIETQVKLYDIASKRLFAADTIKLDETITGGVQRDGEVDNLMLKCATGTAKKFMAALEARLKPDLRVAEVKGTGRYVRVSCPPKVKYGLGLKGQRVIFYTHAMEEDDFSKKSLVVKNLGFGKVVRVIDRDIWIEVENPGQARIKIGHCVKPEQPILPGNPNAAVRPGQAMPPKHGMYKMPAKGHR